MKSIHNQLIIALKDSVPANENLADIISNIVPMSKEAAYRRLRGETQFSLDEAALIAEKVGISIDNLIKIKHKSNVIFNIKPLFLSNPIEEYYLTLKSIISIFESIKDDPNSHIYNASNRLPSMYLFRYPLVFKFTIFKWIYQVQEKAVAIPFSKIIVPQKLTDVQKEFVKTGQHIKMSYIWDDHIFIGLVSDINYFIKINLLTKEDGIELKKELLLMLNEIEESTSTGKYPDGKENLIYIAHTFFESSYIYFESEKHNLSSINLYGINYLTTSNPEICHEQKIWIESLKRYSTLISKSGEIKRMEFFKKRREALKSIEE